jgi:hypothetical protein
MNEFSFLPFIHTHRPIVFALIASSPGSGLPAKQLPAAALLIFAELLRETGQSLDL